MAYRGVLYLLLTLLTGNAWIAALGSALPRAPHRPDGALECHEIKHR